MLKKYFQANKYKHNAAQKLGLGLVFCAKYIAYINPDTGQNERCYAYEQCSLHYINAQKRKAYADCQRIDARCHRKRKHGFDRKIVVFVLIVLAEGFPYHISAYKRKQDKRYPVIYACYEAFKLIAEQEAQRRHKRLKAAEIHADSQHMLCADLFNRKALTYGNRKGIHAQRNTDQEYVYEIQLSSPYSLI